MESPLDHPDLVAEILGWLLPEDAAAAARVCRVFLEATRRQHFLAAALAAALARYPRELSLVGLWPPGTEAPGRPDHVRAEALGRLARAGLELRAQKKTTPSADFHNVALCLGARQPALRRIQPSAFMFAGVTHLLLHRCSLARLPAAIAALVQLVEINVANNVLVELPYALGALPALRQLDVTRNRLRGLPAALGRHPQLVYLAAGFNRLERFEIDSMPRLQVLQLDTNRLRAAPCLAGAPELRALLFDNNPAARVDLGGPHPRLNFVTVSAGAEVACTRVHAPAYPQTHAPAYPRSPEYPHDPPRVFVSRNAEINEHWSGCRLASDSPDASSDAPPDMPDTSPDECCTCGGTTRATNVARSLMFTDIQIGKYW